MNRTAAPGSAAPEQRRSSLVLMFLGMVEILFGVFALALPFLRTGFFAVLLGGVVLGNGILEVVSGLETGSRRQSGLGFVGIAAGVLIVAHPIFDLGFLALLIGSYFLLNGIPRLAAAVRSPRYDRRLLLISGGAGVLFGIVVFLWLPSLGSVIMGIFIGISVLFDGLFSVKEGARLRHAVAAA